LSETLVEKYKNKPLKTEVYRPVRPLSSYMIFLIHNFNEFNQNVHPDGSNLNRDDYKQVFGVSCSGYF